MVLTRKRSSAAAAVTKSAIAQASTMLKELSEKPKSNWSLREAVYMLQESIITALDRGYTYDEVAVLLGKQGVVIAAPSLKRYLAALKRDKGSSLRRGGRKGSKTLDSSSLASVASSLTETPVAQSAAKSDTSAKSSTRNTKRSTAEKTEPKVAAKKAKPTPTATTKTTAAKVTTAKTAAKPAARGRKRSAS